MENIPSENKDFSVYKDFSNSKESESPDNIAGESKDERNETQDGDRRKPWENLVPVGTMLFGQSLGVSPINAQRIAEQRNNDENRAAITEQHHEVSDEEESSSRFVIDNTGGSGLDSEGFAKVQESFVEDDVIDKQEINDIIDITKWEGYELDSIIEIETAYFLPEHESRLWVIPEHFDGMVDQERPVLEYQLFPEIINSIKIDGLINIKTPGGYMITLGEVNDFEKPDGFDARFFTLINITNPDGELKTFASSISGNEADIYRERMKEEYSPHERAAFLISSPQMVVPRILNEDINNFESLLERYRPSYFLVGEEKRSENIQQFLRLMDEDSITRNFSEDYILENKALNDMLELSRYINSLNLKKKDIGDDLDVRVNIPDTDPNSLLFRLYQRYPELNIPLAVQGFYVDKAGKWETSFYREIMDKIQEGGFEGVQGFKIPHRDYTEREKFHNLVFREDMEVDLYGGGFSPENLNIGDIVIRGSNEHLVVIGKEFRPEGGYSVAVVQANRYGNRRLTLMRVDEENIYDVLGYGEQNSVYFVRATE